MKTIKQRILAFAKSQSISLEVFCESIEMTYGAFKGKALNQPINSNALAILVAKYPFVNIQWILTGEGEMQRSKSEFESVVISTSDTIMQQILKRDEELIRENERLKIRLEANGKDSPVEIPPPTVYIPEKQQDSTK